MQMLNSKPAFLYQIVKIQNHKRGTFILICWSSQLSEIKICEGCFSWWTLFPLVWLGIYSITLTFLDVWYKLCYNVIYHTSDLFVSVFIFLMVPFWVINAMKRGSVLDMRTREGVCYEPVKCCSCMWHI